MTFQIQDPNTHGDHDWSKKITASDFEDAAEIWAEDDDGDGDYAIIGSGETEILLVKCLETNEIKKMKVFAESRPYYYAREVK